MNFPLTVVAAAVLTPLVATTALSLGLAATASALVLSQRSAGIAQRQRNASGMSEILQISRLHDELKLDARQDRLWREAEKAELERGRNELRQLRGQLDETLAMLNRPGFDLGAVVLRMEAFKTKELDLLEANRERWQNVFDALNTEQKEKARQFFSKKLPIAP